MAVPIPSGFNPAAASAAAGRTRDVLTDVAKAFAEVGKVIRDLTPGLDETLKRLADIKDAVKDLFRENIGRHIKSVFDGIGKAIMFALPTSLVDGIQNAASKIGAAFGSLGGAAGSLAGAAGGATQAAVSMGQELAKFVGMANPAALQLFTNALDDLYGVIGEALVPVFEIITQVVRLAADTLGTFASTIGGAVATVLKPFVGVLEVLFEVVGQIGQALGGVLEAAAPAIAALVDAFAQVVKAIQPILDVLIVLIGDALAGAMSVLADLVVAVVPLITAFAEAIQGLVDLLIDLINEARFWSDEDIKIGGGTAKGSSVGKAVKGTSIGSVESVLAKAQSSAYSLGTGAASAPERTATFTKMIYDTIVGFPAYLKSLPKDIAASLSDAKGRVEKGDFGAVGDFAAAVMAAKAFSDKAGGGVGAVVPP